MASAAAFSIAAAGIWSAMKANVERPARLRRCTMPASVAHRAQVAGLGPHRAERGAVDVAEHALRRPAACRRTPPPAARPAGPAVRGRVAARPSTLTSVAGAIASCGDRPLPSTRCRPPRDAEPRQLGDDRRGRPAGRGGRAGLTATCRARFSAITLLLSSSICSTMADSGGEDTLARSAARAGARLRGGGPVTGMPSAASRAANEAAAMPAGSVVRALQVVRVVGVLGGAVRSQPSLVDLERGDRGHVAGADVGLRPAGRQVGAGVRGTCRSRR